MIPVKTPVELFGSPYVWRVKCHYPNGEYKIIRGIERIYKLRVKPEQIAPWHRSQKDK